MRPPRNAAAAPLLLLAALAACGTPQQQCIGRQTAELREVSALLAEVEGNRARGYAWDERQVRDTVFDTCRALVPGPDGQPVLRERPCWRDVSTTERFRVPIDPAAEARKADGLRARQAALSRSAEAGVRACKAAYPE